MFDMSSEKLECMIEKKDFVYIFVISIILQFIIYFLSFIYGGSVTALGYVSFAGTLISIILAVIAIGYTYGESIKQKTSSDQLLVEIAGLRDIKDKLAWQVGVLENIADIKSAVEDTKKAVNGIDLAKSLKQFSDMFEESRSNSPNIIVELDKTEEIIKSFKGITDFYILKFIDVIRNKEASNFEDIITSVVGIEFEVDPDKWIDEANHHTAMFHMCLAMGIFTEIKESDQFAVSDKIVDIFQKKYSARDNRVNADSLIGKLAQKVLSIEIKI